MKTLIIGSNRVLNYDSISDAIQKSNIEITELVMNSYFGTCPIINTYASDKGIPTKRFNKDIKDHKFDVLGRDIKMLIYSDVIVVLNDPDCKGTKHLETLATSFKKNIVKVDVPIIDEFYKDRQFIYYSPAPFPTSEEERSYLYVDPDSLESDCDNIDCSEWSDDELISDCEVLEDYFEDGDEESDESDIEVY